jgi:endonuclease YncB( thermonuclease family)
MRRVTRRRLVVIISVLFGVSILIARTVKYSGGGGFLPSRGTVHYVVDGDTIRLTNRVVIRLLEIDAPEMDGDRAELANTATAALKRMVDGRLVELERGPRPMDRYGRYLAYVLVDPPDADSPNAADAEDAEDAAEAATAAARPILVNAEIVRLGLARARTWGPAGPRFDEIRAAETEAREARRGMWRGESARGAE